MVSGCVCVSQVSRKRWRLRLCHWIDLVVTHYAIGQVRLVVLVITLDGGNSSGRRKGISQSVYLTLSHLTWVRQSLCMILHSQ